MIVGRLQDSCWIVLGWSQNCYRMIIGLLQDGYSMVLDRSFRLVIGLLQDCERMIMGLHKDSFRFFIGWLQVWVEDGYRMLQDRYRMIVRRLQDIKIRKVVGWLQDEMDQFVIEWLMYGFREKNLCIVIGYNGIVIGQFQGGYRRLIEGIV